MSGLLRLTIASAVAVLLTALSLQPTLATGRWLWPTLLGVTTVAATGYAARRLRAPRLLVPVLELAALGLVMLVRFTQSVAVWGVLPGRDVRVEVGRLLDEAFTTISTYAPPAAVTPGLAFLLAASIGLIAVVVDTIAVTYRSPALAGLPLLVLYAVPVSVVANGVSWIYFGLAAAGWLTLLLADGRERIGGWGRRLGTRTFTGDPTANHVTPPPEPLGAVGRRIGIAAVALAVLIPAIVPGLSEAVFGRGLGKGTGAGGTGTVTTVNPFVSLGADLNRPEDSTVLTYRTTSDDPEYLRLVTLDSFDGVNWVPAALTTSGRITDGPLPAPDLSVETPRTEVRTEISLAELTDSTWLPAPYPVTAVDVQGDRARDWVWDTNSRVIWSPSSESDGLVYSTRSLDITPSGSQLANTRSGDPTFLSVYTKTPELPELVVREAEAATKEAKTPFAEAKALQDYFTAPGGFVYDTAARADTTDPLTDFLTNKRGFCQQFAGAFAVMARHLGLPTRVVVGFVPGDFDTATQTWTVSWHDTHAWPEVFFEGVGWMRFEPTPSDNAGVSEPAWTQTDSSPEFGGERPEPGAGEPGSAPSASANGGLPVRGTEIPDADKSSAAVGAAADAGFPWVWVIVPLLVVATLLVPSVVRLGQRRRRLAHAESDEPRTAAMAAWAELSATCADLDLGWPPSRTPRQVALGLIEGALLDAHPASDALRRLALAAERARYSSTPTPSQGLADDLRTARAGLVGSVDRRHRILAVLAPVSLLSRAGERTADAFDWVDAAPRRARRAFSDGRPRRRRSTARNTRV
ncbi:MAG TPA: DUF3488 and transglutaminase-like domain-containing protein [Candidatus Limnocylindria bacterium]|nr:DUF3488 and transglutaminase-like domain-containing protein [Candidatus Limnocylindria bacterium]